MSSPAPFEPVSALVERGLNIHHVYGDPVHHGDLTVIPVARVVCGFGAGGGRGPGRFGRALPEVSGDRPKLPDAEGGGGGGGIHLSPAGAIEIGPRGTRFVPVRPLAPLVGALFVGVAAGWLLARRLS